jgi:hypothetical protein
MNTVELVQTSAYNRRAPIMQVIDRKAGINFIGVTFETPQYALFHAFRSDVHQDDFYNSLNRQP